jgi:ATP:cob(I)alamin adenosyltransferase
VKIYTKTGDSGETGLWGGQRVPKDSLRVAAYGTIDECNAAIGLARSYGLPEDLDSDLERIQNQLFVLGSDLATPGDKTRIERVGDEEIAFLEQTIDRMDAELPAMRQFILPGGSTAAAALHLARTVCRRAERECVTLQRSEEINPKVGIYLNRLSDLLFVAARLANQRAGVQDIPWDGGRRRS